MLTAHMVMVLTGTGHVRRHLYFTLSAAEGRLKRARAAGIPARMVLCELRELENGFEPSRASD